MDEMDQLDSKNQEVLYTMFEWPHLTDSRLILIGLILSDSFVSLSEYATFHLKSSGIANSLDLTDRILPRLQARPKMKPKLLNFPPYTKDQIVKILTERLAQVRK